MGRLIIILLLTGLTACSSPYGNYAGISDLYNEKMADDAAHEITALYPPASTHFILSQDTKDAYGVELLKKLRESGFAIEQSKGIGAIFASSDNVPKAESPKIDQSDPNYVPPPAKPTPSAPGKELDYIVDRISENLFRVTITIDTKVINRVYMGSKDGLVPAGSWTMKE